MATRLNNPGTRHFNSSGEPLTGGKLNFYDPGTTTRKDTYSDSALTTPNTNPVILLAGGLEPNIFLDGTYRVILTDADDVQIWDRDSVNSGAGEALGNWTVSISYAIDDTVYASDGNYYISLTNDNLGNEPPSSPSNWAQFEFINVSESQAGNLETIAAISPDDSTFLVGDGTDWVAESGNTVRTSLGLGTGNTPELVNVRLTGLTTGHVVTANSMGGLDAVDMTGKGALLVGDGSDEPTPLAVGANETIPIADNAQPTGIRWGTGVGLVLLATNSASGDATVDFTSGIDSTYDEYVIRLLNVIPTTDGADLYMRTSGDEGSSWDSGSSDYHWAVMSLGSTSNGDEGQMNINGGTNIGADTNEMGASADVHITRPSESAYTTFFANGMIISTDGGSLPILMSGVRQSASAVNGLRFFFDSGNIDSGLFKLYGVRKST